MAPDGRNPLAAMRDWSLTAGLARDVADALGDATNVRAVRRHEIVVREGETADRLFFVMDGAFVVEKRVHRGGAQVTGFLFEGDLIGVVHGDRYTYSVRALVDGRLGVLPRPSFEAICERHPALQHAILRHASNELAAAQDHLMTLGRKSARERVASFLLGLQRRSQLRGGHAGMPLWLPMRRSDIADHLGLTLETVSRVMSELKRDGVIRADTMQWVTIRDPDRLERLAEPV